MQFGMYGEQIVAVMHVYKGNAYIVFGAAPEIMIVPETSLVYMNRRDN